MALTIVIFHFAAPFVLLLMRGVKRHADRLLQVCILMIAIRMVDVYWIVEPAFYSQQIQSSLDGFRDAGRGRRLVAGGIFLAIEIEPAGSAAGSAVAGRAAGKRWRF